MARKCRIVKQTETDIEMVMRVVANRIKTGDIDAMEQLKNR